jgi:hypothetical protein
MVSFNGRPAERYEIESTDAQFVHDTLVQVNQTVVEADAVVEPKPLEVKDGQIVVPEVKTE